MLTHFFPFGRNGSTVPLGPASDTGILNPEGYTLNYNEFIVYSPNQVRMRYLLKVRFNFLQLWWMSILNKPDKVWSSNKKIGNVVLLNFLIFYVIKIAHIYHWLLWALFLQPHISSHVCTFSFSGQKVCIAVCIPQLAASYSGSCSFSRIASKH